MFVVFEGPSGAGKSTQVARVSERLQRSGISARTYKFPSTEDIGVLCRAYAMCPETRLTLACLIAADFYRAFERGITASVEDSLLLCDRYVVSSYVYQRMQGLAADFLAGLYSELPIPDVTFVLQADEHSLTARRREPSDIFKAADNVQRELALYRDALTTPPPRSGPLHSVNSDRSLDGTTDEIFELILQRWKLQEKASMQ